jgi:magnesium-transporting ATPase (P-type)
VNVVALVVAFVAALTGKGTPLKAIQLLWVNLIMDTLAALALGTEAPTPKLLEQPPAGRNYPLVSAVMWRNIIGQAVYQLITMFSLLYLGDVLLGHESETTYSNTVLFNAFVFCQLFNEINSRKANHEWNVFANLLTNSVFIGILILTAVLQVLIVEFGGTVFSTEPLSAHDWFISVAIGAFSLLWGALVRLVPAPAVLCCAIKTHDHRGFDLEEEETRALLPSKRR